MNGVFSWHQHRLSLYAFTVFWPDDVPAVKYVLQNVGNVEDARKLYLYSNFP